MNSNKAQLYIYDAQYHIRHALQAIEEMLDAIIDDNLQHANAVEVIAQIRDLRVGLRMMVRRGRELEGKEPANIDAEEG